MFDGFLCGHVVRFVCDVRCEITSSDDVIGRFSLRF